VHKVAKGRKQCLEKNGVGHFVCSAWFAKADEFAATTKADKAAQGRIIIEASPDEVTCC